MVATPIAIPLPARSAATLEIASESVPTPIALLKLLLPVERAVPEAAESVTPFVAEYVVTKALSGNCVKQNL